MTIENIINRQINFQKSMNSTATIMKLALVEELGEFVASTGFADWKPVKRDEANMDIELIDIAVFAINIAYYEDKIHHDFEPLMDPKNDLALVDEIMKLYVLEQWIEIAYYIFNSNPELIKVIVAKQALNKLRQDYGYKKGDYIKDWNGQEDNVYLEGFYGFYHDEVYNEMEAIYTEKIIGSRLVDI